jgi:hypothetical protein
MTSHSFYLLVWLTHDRHAMLDRPVSRSPLSFDHHENWYEGISPLIAVTPISKDPDLHGVCGLNKDQARIIASTYLGHRSFAQLNEISHTMERYFNGYYFTYTKAMDESDADDSDAGDNIASDNVLDKKSLETLYSPHHVYHYLYKLKKGHRITSPENSVSSHSIGVLETIADTGDFSMRDIVQLIEEGFIYSSIVENFGFADLST